MNLCYNEYDMESDEYDENLDRITNFKSGNHFVSTDSSYDLVISQFTSDTYGEAYMFVNWADRDVKNEDGTVEKVKNQLFSLFFSALPHCATRTYIS